MSTPATALYAGRIYRGSVLSTPKMRFCSSAAIRRLTSFSAAWTTRASWPSSAYRAAASLRWSARDFYRACAADTSAAPDRNGGFP